MADAVFGIAVRSLSGDVPVPGASAVQAVDARGDVAVVDVHGHDLLEELACLVPVALGLVGAGEVVGDPLPVVAVAVVVAVCAVVVVAVVTAVVVVVALVAVLDCCSCAYEECILTLAKKNIKNMKCAY